MWIKATKSLRYAFDAVDVVEVVEDNLVFFAESLPLRSFIKDEVTFSTLWESVIKLGDGSPPELNGVSSSLELVDLWSSSCSCLVMETPLIEVLLRFWLTFTIRYQIYIPNDSVQRWYLCFLNRIYLSLPLQIYLRQELMLCWYFHCQYLHHL